MELVIKILLAILSVNVGMLGFFIGFLSVFLTDKKGKKITRSKNKKVFTSKDILTPEFEKMLLEND